MFMAAVSIQVVSATMHKVSWAIASLFAFSNQRLKEALRERLGAPADRARDHPSNVWVTLRKLRASNRVAASPDRLSAMDSY
jgi:hypothetical protein